MEKDDARIMAMRQRSFERTKRFLNAKQRSIGIDKEYLDKQVQEKNETRLLKKKEEEEEGKFCTQ